MDNLNFGNELFMNRCIEIAGISKQRGESPVGSVIVRNGQIIGEGVESVQARNDISFHSEIEAIRDACQQLGHRDLSGCVLYTTHEPCIMCSFIIRQTKISKVIFGLSTGEIGGFSSKLSVLTDQTVERWNQPPEIICGFMENECRTI
ncbi:MAG: nucleoside deaminase [Moheibacter sp.]